MSKAGESVDMRAKDYRSEKTILPFQAENTVVKKKLMWFVLGFFSESALERCM